MIRKSKCGLNHIRQSRRFCPLFAERISKKSTWIRNKSIRHNAEEASGGRTRRIKRRLLRAAFSFPRKTDAQATRKSISLHDPQDETQMPSLPSSLISSH